jgi:hypothetical protein
MDKYLKAYDKNLVAVGVLPYAHEIQRKRRLNSDYSLSFLLPMDKPDYIDMIPLRGHVMDEKGQYYVINSRKRNRDGLKRLAQIDCSHIMFKLIDFKMPYTSYIEEDFGIDIVVLTNLISAATGGKFIFSIDSAFDLADIKDFGRGNAMQALVYVINTYGCEVDPNNFIIHLKAQIGVNDGLQYRFKKNIMSDSFADSTQGLVTRMFGEMKDGLTFIGLPASNLTAGELALLSAIPGAIVGGIIKVNYLISQYAPTWADTTNTYFDGEHIDQNIEDQLTLLKATRKALTELEVPSIDISVDAADLFKINSREPKPNMGDTVYLIDPLMDMNNITARIVEIAEYPYQLDKHTTVTLANYMLRDYKDIIADLDSSKRNVNNLLSGGRVRASAFEEYARVAVNDINNSKTQVIYDGRGIVLQSTVNPLHQVVESAEGIYLTIDGGATALAAITANGIIAERIFGTIGSFVNLSADSIVAGSLNGINMQIGLGSNAFHADASGISLGGISWGLSPFRVDMAGNAWATSMTLSQPNISNGSIVGTSINIGNGKFVVDAAGNMTATNGNFTGSINSGSSITGANINTAASGRRINLSGNAMVAYDGSGNRRISMNDASIQADSSIAFFHPDGNTLSSIIYQTGTQTIFNGGLGGSDKISFFNNIDFLNATISNFNLSSGTVGGSPIASQYWVQNVAVITAKFQ